MRKLAIPEEVLADVFGHIDDNLRTIEKELGVRLSARGGEITIQGDPEREALAASLLAQMAGLAQGGYSIKKVEYVYHFWL